MGLRDMENRTGISVSVLSRIETRKRKIFLSDFIAICMVLKMNPMEFLCDSVEWNPERVCL